jgi:hypothetical protein
MVMADFSAGTAEESGLIAGDLGADARRRLREMKDIVAMEGDEVEPVVLKGARAQTIVDRTARPVSST